MQKKSQLFGVPEFISIIWGGVRGWVGRHRVFASRCPSSVARSFQPSVLSEDRGPCLSAAWPAKQIANLKLITLTVRSSCARFKSIRIDAGLCICNANLCIFLQMQSESLITRCMNRYKSNMQYYEVMQNFANLKHICSNLHKSI